MSLDPIESWRARLLGRVYQQFKDLPAITGIVEAFAAQVAEVETMLQALGTLNDIDASEGAQLQILGTKVGQPYAGESDAVYRLLLKARIRANRSTGTASDLYAVLVALFGASTWAVFTPGSEAEGTIRVNVPDLSSDEAAVAVAFMGDSKAAGVRLVVEWDPLPDADMFTMDGGDGLGFGDYNDGSIGGAFAGALAP